LGQSYCLEVGMSCRARQTVGSLSGFCAMRHRVTYRWH
jgi:hypothetical protein